jgi:sRNA-binding regulator protein Hfq
MKSDNLVGNEVTLFMDGGWSVSGRVTTSDSEKLILTKNNELFLIFKNKVSFLKLDDIKNSSVTQNKKSDTKNQEANDLEQFPENSISYDESILNIPRSLLSKQPAIQEEDDLSISFKESGKNNNVLNFRIEDDS